MPKRAPDTLASDPDLEEKKRARRRLLGAVVLALLAAVVLPLFLDSEPRKPVQDVQVEIQPREPRDPARAEAQSPPESSANSSAAAAVVAETPPPKPEAAQPGPEPAESGAPEIASKTKPAAAVTPPPSAAKPRQGAEAVKAAGTAPKPTAVKTAPNGTSPERPFAVQIGAFASEKGAKEQLARARKAGLKAYTERLPTPKGERIRVRVGPFKTREDAEKARVRLKAAGIDSAIIAP